MKLKEIINIRVIRIFNTFSVTSRFIGMNKRGRHENKAILKA
jgi:hypothetical protein